MTYTAPFKLEIEVRSFKRTPDNRRSVYLNLAGSIESQLREAYAKRHEKDGTSQSAVAARLGVDRSVVNRRLTGRTNMRIDTIADMVWALGHCIKVEIFDPDETNTNETVIIPSFEPFSHGESERIPQFTVKNEAATMSIQLDEKDVRELV